MRKWSLSGLALCLAAAVVAGQLVSAGRTPANPGEPVLRADEPKTEGQSAPGKGKRAKEFIAAFEKGDARAVAAFWTPDGQYVDQVGQEFKGRAAIEKLYAKLFAVQKGAKLTITVLSAKLLAPEVGLEEGISEVTPADGSPATSGRFSAVLVKKDGEWYFESVHETIASPPSNSEHFEDLEWLIGDWTGSAAKGEGMQVSYAWAENRNFLVSSFATTVNDVPVVGGTQWVAWDAIDKQIRSWSFYSGGGFGRAVWSHDGGQWTIKTTGQSADGKKLTATNILTRVDAEHATWQMTKLTVNGKEMPETPMMKLKRVKSAQP